MAGNSNLIEKAVQLIDDGRDLLRQVSGVHVDVLPAAYQDAAFTMQQNSRIWRVSKGRRNE